MKKVFVPFFILFIGVFILTSIAFCTDQHCDGCDMSTEHLISEIYVATFGRAPANAGLNYWAESVDTGYFTIDQVAQSFFDQPETKEKLPEALSNSEFITNIFDNVLNRAPADAGLTYWVDALDSGEIRRDQAIMAIINGAKSATGSSEDAATLAKKTEIGLLFAYSDVGSMTDDESFMDWAANIISSAANDDFDVEEAEEYIAELLSDIEVQLKIVKSSASYDDFPNYDSADMEELVNGFSDYTFDFYHQASADESLQDKNIFFSTYSIENALAMTWAGAKNNTADEMADSLHFTLPSSSFHSTLNALNVDINSRDDTDPFFIGGDAFQLNLVNAVWSNIGYPFLASYLDILAQNYDAGVHTLDFSGQPDASRLVINRWVEDQTNEKIKDLLPEGSILSDTAVVLTNAIYFKASWCSQFDEGATIPGDFTRLDNSTVSSQMMHQTVRTRFFQSEDFDAVELPYVSPHDESQYSQELSMLLIAPHNGRFDSVESALDNNFIQSILSSLSIGDVELTLPKFEFDCEIRCKQIMRNLGMIDAFIPYAADFSNMVDPEDSTPYIDEIYHKAFIAVDEKGTEAAAATAVVVDVVAAYESVSISMDRPFIFLIRDDFTGTILFMGRVIDPSL
ncbi:serpin family protein [Desulfobacter postgatei]|jgi:serpin B|uniref:Serine protease inhibitor n=1 Tax=Desulfobacter postgatei 2ac9 TaxID=879212 RepID=I5AYK0_9BACT|nr:serpin family protein [Desulfobacter postgatei]EIM62313.1 serine protease inhibitor [Desulfobacter postgatei 2ac9]MDX9964948.1 serpin family protein [Desulfobacter postgatei]